MILNQLLYVHVCQICLEVYDPKDMLLNQPFNVYNLKGFIFLADVYVIYTYPQYSGGGRGRLDNSPGVKNNPGMVAGVWTTVQE